MSGVPTVGWVDGSAGATAELPLTFGGGDHRAHAGTDRHQMIASVLHGRTSLSDGAAVELQQDNVG